MHTCAKMYASGNNTGKIIKKNKTEKDKNVQKVAQGLKGMGGDSDWLIARYAQKTPLLIKRIGTTRLDHARRPFSRR